MLQVMGDHANPEDAASMVAHLESHPADAAALQWILELEGIPLYFLYPTGPFAQDTFATLRAFLREQIEEGVERISMPGTIVGTAPHRMGLELPVVAPELRGMFSWTTEALVSSLVSSDADEKIDNNASEERLIDNNASEERLADVHAGVAAFLDRVYFDLRNPGVSDRERALNYAATNAFSIEHIYERAIKEQMEIDTIDVEPTSIGVPGLSMWEVKLSFFFPDRPPQSPRRMYRFTISVEDVMPITIGPVRSWMVR
jgi:cyanobactin maturation PatA/PatG family protease